MMKKKNLFLMKFTVVAGMIGLFSPSVSVHKTQLFTETSATLAPFEVSISLLNTAEARGRAKKPVHHGGNHVRPRPRPSTRPVNKDINRNVNRNINKNVNVNVNHRYYGGYGHGYGYYYGSPIVAFTTGLVIGSIIAASTMPKSCTTVMVGGVSYRQCGSSYYMPVYQGDTLVYKAVASPY
jgi:hypothetical protein